ncbi:DUF2914 domain-containing protein [bacterium]|nr:DUF2914 domain-containing protein [bacterium]NUN45940.1 DUF2914 domain-containing protein [bacterium]
MFKIIPYLFVFTGISLSICSQDYYDTGDYTAMLTQAEETASADGKKILETGRTMTLTNAEILPGSCWDYANAVFDRAGYVWGKRETVFKSVKAGPFVDIEKIKNGDWLYYINHSYGDIEHSAIFVEWIDKENKLALMLSYGGENRQQPARYLPYDLRSVYGITRANSKLGEDKPTPKPKTVTSTNVAPVTNAVSNTGNNTSVKANNSNATTNKNAAPSETQSTPAGGNTIDGMLVESLRIGTGVANMEITGVADTFSSSTTEKIYCWLRVNGGQGKTVKVRWIHNGNSLGEVPLDIRSQSMRTYAFRTVSGRKGSWKVEIVDAQGRLLRATDFTVN